MKTEIPTQHENPNGLHQRYYIQKMVCTREGFWDEGIDLRPIDKDAEYFVLRLDEKGKDPKHINACRIGINAYAEAIKDHLPELAADLKQRYPVLSPAPLSSIGKTDEEILQPLWDAFAAKHPESLRTLKEVKDEFPESIEPILEAMRHARLSALSEGKTETKENVEEIINQGLFFVDRDGIKLGVMPVTLCRQAIAASKPAIPESIEQCRLTKEDLEPIIRLANLHGDSLEIAGACGAVSKKTEDVLMEKFAAYLGKTAKELPTKSEIEEWAHNDITVFKQTDPTAHYDIALNARIKGAEWLSSRASEALRQKDEQHRKEVESANQLITWLLVKFDPANEEDTFNDSDNFLHALKFQLESYKAEYQLFLSSPPLGEKGK